METVFLVYAYNVESMTGHSWVDRAFSTRDLAKKYIGQKLGIEIKDNDLDCYETMANGTGYSINEIPFNAFENLED